MFIKCLPVGHLMTNCYVVGDETSRLCAVIDPGDESNTILDYLEENHLKCEAILLTHGHYDHVGAVETVQEETGATVYMHPADAGSAVGSDMFAYEPPDGSIMLHEGSQIQVGPLTFDTLETPGHTPGGVTFRCENALFTGDTLFQGSCGRTDLPGGDMMTELASLKRLCELPGDYEVYPGHMGSSTLERERLFNYYCRAALRGL